MGYHRHSELPRHNGRPLTEVQMAAARLLSVGFSEFSEAVHGAGWREFIEHEIWEWLHPSLEPTPWNKKGILAEEASPHWMELARGIGFLGEVSQVWVYLDKNHDDTAIHLSDWNEMHSKWCDEMRRNGGGIFL
jgi:hypothetical protein